MKRKSLMKNLARLVFLACTATLLAQQPTLPSAPDPKPAPSPFKVPSKMERIPPSGFGSDKKDNDKKDYEEVTPGLSGILAEPLEPRQKLILKEYLSAQFIPAVRSCWFSVIPEEAQAKRRPPFPS